MKVSKIFLFSALVVLFACETIVDVKVNTVDPYLVVDAWLTHEPGEQVIKLSYTQSYYDNTFPTGIKNATVKVTDSEGEVFDFVSDNTGRYVLNSTDSFGVVGRDYFLEIDWNGHIYTSSSSLNRKAQIDSIRYTYEPASGFGPEYYYTEFFGRDPLGEGDAYWLKAWRNGKYLNQPAEIYPIFDASFSEGNGDGIPFIFPIRIYPNPSEIDINGKQLPPYFTADTFEIGSDGTFKLFETKVKVTSTALEVIGNGKDIDGGIKSFPLDGEPFYQLDATHIAKKADSVYLELHAITPAAWFFITRMQQEINRPIGFGALFATPPSNVPTNIIPDDSNVKVAGFFSVANVSSMGARLSKENILPSE